MMVTWAFWLLICGGVVLISFLVLEARALLAGKPTLSASMRQWGRDYPVLPFIAGIIFGLLAGHFWG